MSSSPQLPKNISLPSINELFPEHLLAKPPSPIQRYPSSSSRTSPTARYAPDPNFSYPQTSAIIAVPARSRRDASSPTSSDGSAEDTVAPSANVPDSHRTATPSAFGYAGCGSDTSMSLITKAKPAFRVELRVPESAHGLSVPPFERFPRPDEPKGPAPYPPNFSANPYLSGAAGPPGGGQGLRGPPSPQDGPAGAEEKRHCCPHCNKRFNRPSSLNIHVNTHTGAKRAYPGCNRRFNVNSNMRRHYRNHLTSRRRDAVARLIQHPPGASHSPPLSSASPSRSPEPAYEPGAGYRYPQAQYPLEHTSSYSDPEEYDAGRTPGPRHHPYARARPPSPPSPYYPADVKRETPDPALPAAACVGVPESNMREDRAQCRLRANSSPMPRYREDRALRHAEPACDRPGCSCNARPVSTALRPAFPEYLPPPAPTQGDRARQYAP
ncbi:hypothetical protein DAEQUDRAFT_760258 [Daedalea quercina L-15889]|uniref:C2H2-type domain-containing protein n=1 Tax=Daedalea quercina L-15889 TaxID=1314783 RepID=A0A165L3C9_9APHY|nr:hypothetical protein DAEQUDRAFT_760258 [Daedalea quercina L-15889]